MSFDRVINAGKGWSSENGLLWLVYSRHFDFPQCRFQYPTINICAPPTIPTSICEAELCQGFCMGLGKSQKLKVYIRSENEAWFKFKFWIPV